MLIEHENVGRIKINTLKSVLNKDKKSEKNVYSSMFIRTMAAIAAATTDL